MSMNKILRVGIAGFGVVGKRRRQVIDKLASMQVVAVCDKNYPEPGVFDDGVAFYTNYQQLLAEELDVLFVCLTNDIAAKVTCEGLRRGLHVFCEKPPGRNLQDIVNVIECKKKYPQLKLKYGFNHRYHDSIMEALRIVSTKELGAIQNLRGVYGKSNIITFDQPDWRTKRSIAGGGILLDQGIHMVDLLRLFAGEFVDIHSFISNKFWNFDVEDNAYAIMRTVDGKVAMLHSSATEWRHQFCLDITLEKGNLLLEGILSGSKSYGAETLTIAFQGNQGLGDPREQRMRYNTDYSWSREVAEFLDAIVLGKEIIHGSAEDALKTMHLVYKIYCADNTWRNRWKLNSEIPCTEETSEEILCC